MMMMMIAMMMMMMMLMMIEMIIAMMMMMIEMMMSKVMKGYGMKQLNILIHHTISLSLHPPVIYHCMHTIIITIT